MGFELDNTGATQLIAALGTIMKTLLPHAIKYSKQYNSIIDKESTRNENSGRISKAMISYHLSGSK